MADTKQERFPDYPTFKARLLHLRFRGRTRAASPRRSCRWRSHRHEAAQGLAQQEE